MSAAPEMKGERLLRDRPTSEQESDDLLAPFARNRVQRSHFGKFECRVDRRASVQQRFHYADKAKTRSEMQQGETLDDNEMCQ